MKKVLITVKVTTHFTIKLFESITCTLGARPTADSRFNGTGCAVTVHQELLDVIQQSIDALGAQSGCATARIPQQRSIPRRLNLACRVGCCDRALESLQYAKM